MRPFIYISIFVSLIIAGCSNSPVKQANTINMDSTKKENPVFSKTDTAKVEINNEEWKKIFSGKGSFGSFFTGNVVNIFG